jgi:hypothetical protein
VYEFSGGMGIAPSVTGQRMLQWSKNGSAIAGGVVRMPASANGNAMAARTILVNLAVSDYVELFGHQNTGGTIATVTTSELQSTMTVRRISS